MKKSFLLFVSLIIFNPFLSYAADWKIIPEKSKLEFKAVQNDSAVFGSFKKFAGKINFDPTQLKNSKIEIEIDTTSITCSLHDCIETLETAQWLSIKTFPKAIFSADNFVKVSDKKFKAMGKLIIKDKHAPATIEFTLEEYSQTKALAVGEAVVKRSDFIIGPKDPANAHGVKDEVVVSFVINAIK